jgi:hypothetical protein
MRISSQFRSPVDLFSGNVMDRSSAMLEIQFKSHREMNTSCPSPIKTSVAQQWIYANHVENNTPSLLYLQRVA